MTAGAHLCGIMEVVVSSDPEVIDMPTDFSKVPGGRFIKFGPFSGQAFRVEKLLPALSRARARGSSVLVRLDGVAGYNASFLEEAFGGLVRIEGFTSQELKGILEVQAEAKRFKVFRDLIWSFIVAADGRRK